MQLILNYQDKLNMCVDIGSCIGFDSVMCCVNLKKSPQNTDVENSIIDVESIKIPSIEKCMSMLFWVDSVSPFINNSNMWHQFVYGLRHITQDKMNKIINALRDSNTDDQFVIQKFDQWTFVFIECENVPPMFEKYFIRCWKDSETTNKRTLYEIDLLND